MNNAYSRIIEAILFAMGDSVELTRLSNVLGESEETTRRVVEELAREYEEQDRGLRIIELEGAFQMCTAEDMYEHLLKIAKTPKKYVLTDSLLETLSVIAYKQPVTRLEIEKVRGVNSDHSVSKLVEYGFVKELGRLNAPGKPLLFGTTEQFLRSFGVRSLEELPHLKEDQIEDFRAQAEQEARIKLDI